MKLIYMKLIKIVNLREIMNVRETAKLKRNVNLRRIGILFSLVLLLAGCGKQQEAAGEANAGVAESTGAGSAENSANEGVDEDANKDADSNSDLSGVTLRFGSTTWEVEKTLLQLAGLDDTPYQVEYSVFQGGNLCLEAMLANQIDLTITSEIPPIFAALADNGDSFKVIAVKNDSTQNQELVIPAGSDIKEISDLRGKKVGYIKSTTAHYFLYKMLEEAGVGWDEIEGVEVTTADGATALVSNELDAFASYGQSINVTKNNGAVMLATAEDILSGNFPYEASVTALADEGKRAAIADYLARLELAYDWIKENYEEWAQVSADPTGMTYEENLDLIERGLKQRDTHVKVVSDEVIGTEKEVGEVLFAVGLIEQEVDVESLYDDSLTEAYNTALEALKDKYGR